MVVFFLWIICQGYAITTPSAGRGWQCEDYDRRVDIPTRGCVEVTDNKRTIVTAAGFSHQINAVMRLNCTL